MLLLSFASQTSHFWQLGGVMQAKMRSLLRLLVKSIIRDRERQPNAAAARKAHHSPFPPETPQTELTGHRDRYTCSLIHRHKQSCRDPAFYSHCGTYLHFYLSKASLKEENPRWKILISWQSNVIATCFR